MREEQRRDVLAIGIENHVASDTFVRFCSGQSVTDPSFIQARSANGVEQKAHSIVGKRSELIWLFVVARLVVIIEFQPARISAVGS